MGEDVKREMGEMEFVDVKIENIAETDDVSTSSEVHVTEVRRHDSRGQFEDTRKDEIDLWEDVDGIKVVERVELSGVDYKKEILDIKDSLMINDETEYTDDCPSQSLRYFNSVIEDNILL